MEHIYSTENVLDAVKDDIYFEQCAPKMTINVINKYDLTIDHLYHPNMIAINESFDYDYAEDVETFAHVCVRVIGGTLFIIKMIRDFVSRKLISAQSFCTMRGLISSL